MSNPIETSALALNDMLAVLKAGGEETRLRVLGLLSLGELSIKDLTAILGQSQPRVSHHIKLLVSAGIVHRHPEANWVFCRLAETGGGAEIVRAVLQRMSVDDPVLSADRARLEALKRERAKAAERFFNAIAGEWDRVRALQIGEAEVEQALKRLTAPRRFRTMLDLGTGTARMLELFSDRVERGIGIDISHTMLAHARARLDAAGLGNCQVRHGDITSLSQDAASADLVVIHHVLHYFDDPQPVLREAARVLAGGGQLLIVDFAPHTQDFLRSDYAHRRLGFTHDQMDAWLEATGFSPVRVTDMSQAGGTDDERLTVTIWLAQRNRAAAGNTEIGAAA